MENTLNRCLSMVPGHASTEPTPLFSKCALIALLLMWLSQYLLFLINADTNNPTLLNWTILLNIQNTKSRIITLPEFQIPCVILSKNLNFFLVHSSYDFSQDHQDGLFLPQVQLWRWSNFHHTQLCGIHFPVAKPSADKKKRILDSSTYWSTWTYFLPCI